MPYVNAMVLAGFPPSGGDVDEVIVLQGMLYPLVHVRSPMALTS
jgi:hypothetical protein